MHKMSLFCKKKFQKFSERYEALRSETLIGFRTLPLEFLPNVLLRLD